MTTSSNTNSMTRTTLFKMDANSKIREWTIWTEHFPNKSLVHVRHGVNGGKQVIDSTPFSLFSHETDSVSFMESKVRYMMNRRGYTEDIPRSVPYRPMLLQRYKDHVYNLPEDLIQGPKLNGFRCLASKYWIKSRTNDHYTAIAHLPLANLPDDIVLDGELYIHNKNIQYHQTHITPDKPTLLSSTISLFVFDVIAPNLSYAERLALLQDIFNDLSISTPEIWPSPIYPHEVPEGPGGVFWLRHIPLKKSMVDETHNWYLSQGYEGSVIRNPNSHYQINVRSNGVLKYKPIQRMNVKILDIIPMEKEPNQGVLILQNPMGGQFSCSIKASHFLRQRYLRERNLHIGKLCEVEYEDFSEMNKPLKPICVRIL
jgi:hypothetical protein